MRRRILALEQRVICDCSPAGLRVAAIGALFDVATSPH